MMTKEEAIKAYEDLIQLRRFEILVKNNTNLGKIEIHHILPISCEGKDVEDNKIALYAKEHFMAHVYLWIIHHDDKFHNQTMCALNNMVKGTLNGSRKELRDFILASEEYQKAREEFAQYNSLTISSKISGEKNGAYGKHWYYDPITGKSYLCTSNFAELNSLVKGRLCSRTIQEKQLSEKPKNTLSRSELYWTTKQTYIDLLPWYYDNFLKFGYEWLNENYPYSVHTFIRHCIKFIPGFKTQKGKPRIIHTNTIS